MPWIELRMPEVELVEEALREYVAKYSELGVDVAATQGARVLKNVERQRGRQGRPLEAGA